MKIKYGAPYFNMQKDAVHISEVEVQRMVDDVTNRLLGSSDKSNYAFIATGDTIVFGYKWDDEIEVHVTQDYHTAILLRDENDKWRPLDWYEQEEVDDIENMSREELIAQLKMLRAEYNPRREI